AQALHPGYGFLSENATFCQQCAAAGLEFIGPDPQAISKMGDKLVAKEFMADAGLPMVPSWSGDPDKVAEGAERVGFPLLVKAAAGGGGKGMRLVRQPEKLAEAVERAQGEALKAFGDDRIFLERFIENPRHIEVQIFGDKHGNAVCFGERECSLQRRYQKIVEEAPSKVVTPELRARLVEAGVNAVKALRYCGAGTVEFILDQQGEFYFLEVNTRLQVEHPVTELVYGVDLVALQIAVAQGEPLELPESYLNPRGWSIEARIYAEDPDNNFLPSVGTLHTFHPPSGHNLRLDTGFKQGDEVSIHFDPMLAKLISYGRTREEARLNLLAGLKDFAVLGVTTNIPYLIRILSHQTFIEADFDTQFLERNPEHFEPRVDPDERELAAALAGVFGRSNAPRVLSETTTSPTSPWQTLGNWRHN
ncbi:MAG TPA: ATP-grasp domain-containing protein, partial [Phycisphaerales bacterium]|nr:ATP-grasp domain-containing protein [Phycisphaerales bacterium]